MNIAIRGAVGIVNLAAMLTSVTFGQVKPNTPMKPLTVCEALRDLKKLNGKMIAIHGVFHFTQRHGGWILDQSASGGPCPNMPRKARIWWSGIWLVSVGDVNIDGGSVSFTEERPLYHDLVKEYDHHDKGSERNMLVTLIGEIRTKKNLLIVRAPDDRGDTMGKGYGVGGAFPAMLVVKTVGEVRVLGKTDRH